MRPTCYGRRRRPERPSAVAAADPARPTGGTERRL